MGNAPQEIGVMRSMTKTEKVIKGTEICLSGGAPDRCRECPYHREGCDRQRMQDTLELLKEQEKKRIILHKKHVITWSRNDEFSMRKLYEAICETLLDEGELFIARTDNHEKVDFVFYVTESGEVG